jgi:hypothetical protein
MQGTDANHVNGWSTLVNNALNSGSKHILGFNEPDNSGQSNMSPQQAAAAWKQYIQPYGSRAKLVSPAVTNGAAPMGLAWLDSFFAACSGCQIDAVAIHIYDSATNIAYFKNYISAGACYSLLISVFAWLTIGYSERAVRQPPGLGDRVPWERLCQRRDQLHQHDDALARRSRVCGALRVLWGPERHPRQREQPADGARLYVCERAWLVNVHGDEGGYHSWTNGSNHCRIYHAYYLLTLML